MSSPYVENANHKVTATPQTEPISPNQAKNNAGGYSFVVDDWKRLERFLILGSEGGTYYVKEKKLTRENAACVERCLAADYLRTLATLLKIGGGNRAPKQDPALFALALALKAPSLETRTAARALVPQLARTGTHLLHLVAMLDGLGGWGRGTKKAVAEWYVTQNVQALAYQLVKYQQRDGWSHADVLRLIHAEGPLALFRWATSGVKGLGAREVKKFEKGAPEKAKLFKYDEFELRQLPRIVQAFEEAKTADTATLVKLITEDNLPRECVPTEKLNEPKVWEALLVNMPITAMIRNLAKMTSIGLVAPLSAAARTVSDRLQDVTRLEAGRVHPLQVLVALSVYNKGKGDKGSLTWAPVQNVVKALDDAFYLSFKAVPSLGKRHLIGVDVSGSMDWTTFAGTNITPRTAAAALAMLVARREPQFHIMAFSHGIIEVPGITPSSGLPSVIDSFTRLGHGGTDCALPMIYALKNRIPVDCFQVMTDNETWAGSQHPAEALREYRHKMGIPAKLVVHGMTATEFTIADPHDGGMMDVVGFDSAVPVVVDDFLRG